MKLETWKRSSEETYDTPRVDGDTIFDKKCNHSMASWLGFDISTQINNIYCLLYFQAQETKYKMLLHASIFKVVYLEWLL